MMEVPPAKNEDLNNDDRHGGVVFGLGGIREMGVGCIRTGCHGTVNDIGTVFET
jgi:hypothetical protein